MSYNRMNAFIVDLGVQVNEVPLQFLFIEIWIYDIGIMKSSVCSNFIPYTIVIYTLV